MANRLAGPGRLGAALLILFAGSFEMAAAARLLPFQGKLTDATGRAVADGAKVVQFKIYNAPIGGQSVWAGEVQKLTVNSGLVSTMLGSKASLQGVDFNHELYLELTIDANGDDQITSADPPLLPRQSIVPAVFALDAGRAAVSTVALDSQKLAGRDWSSLLVSGNDPETGQLRGDKIAPGSVPLASLHPDVQGSLSATLVQGMVVPGFTAAEAVQSRDALAYLRDGSIPPRLVPASSTNIARSAFFGFATGPAPAGSPVGAHQFGPLGGFTGLLPGRSYHLGEGPGRITHEYPLAGRVYVGHAMSDTVLFVDPFGLSKAWATSGNYWGNRSDGSLETSGDVSFAATLDGPVVVKQFDRLWIKAGHKVTTDSRCRGLVIYVDGDAIIDGTLTMTARGANVNPTLPDSIAPTGIRLIRFKTGGSASLAASDLGGSGVGGVGALWRNVEAHQAGATGNGEIYTVAREGGAGGEGGLFGVGHAGTSVNGTGGGGAGWGSGNSVGGSGSAGTCYSGGSGGGGSVPGRNGESAQPYGGKGGDAPSDVSRIAGGGAGNPAGYPRIDSPGTEPAWGAEYGTGGLLILLVRGNLTIGPQGRIVANGMQGGQGSDGSGGPWTHPGGSSGGGRIVVLHAGSLANHGAPDAIKAAGGAAKPGENFNLGSFGGDGAVTIDQIDP